MDEIEKAFAGTGPICLGSGHDRNDPDAHDTQRRTESCYWGRRAPPNPAVAGGPPATRPASRQSASHGLAAMQKLLVGASGERLRMALQIVDAVSQGRSLWIATLQFRQFAAAGVVRRRFTLGTFFFDLPTTEERDVIWRISPEEVWCDGRPS